jgi:hypothetical protein
MSNGKSDWWKIAIRVARAIIVRLKVRSPGFSGQREKGSGNPRTSLRA